MMNKPGATGLKRIINAFFYSMKGIKAAFKSEAAFRQEALLAIILIPLAFWLSDTKIELILMVGSVLLLMMMELVNSSIEAIVDRIGPEIHPLSGQAKDIGSAIVFFAMMILALVWGGILLF